MEKVKKAVVLAAGLGTRLRPLTCVCPKPLMPIWGVPMLTRIVETLRGWGVEDIAVNAHFLPGQVRAWAESCGIEGVRIRVNEEKEILGTGGVLNPLRDWLGDDDFYLVNGDIVAEGIEECPFEAVREARGIPAEVIGWCLVSEQGPRTIEAEPEAGLVTCWKSPDPGWAGTWTYCGIALLTSAVLDYVKPGGFSTIVEAYEKAMMDGKFMRIVAPASLVWADAGTVDGYLELNRDGDENAYADMPQLKAALAAAGRPGARLEFLGARGSERAFWRLSHPGGSAIAIVYDDAHRAENARYAGHARWLAAQGVPVPAVLADLPEMKTLVLEDCGSVDLAKRVEKAGPRTIESYVPVVEALAKFNACDASALGLEPPFDAALWKWERDLFAEHCLGARYAREMPNAVERELGNVASLLQMEPTALVHRDFQSTNVIWRDGAFKFIDFQGMRLGPAAYDLASLLYDPYVALTEGDRRVLATLYGKVSGRPGIVKVLPFAAVQRLCQALGAYGRLASVGQTGFTRYVLPALVNLLAAADEAGLDAVGALAEDLIAEEKRRYETLHAHGAHDHGGGCTCGHHDRGHQGCTCGHHHEYRGEEGD